MCSLLDYQVLFQRVALQTTLLYCVFPSQDSAFVFAGFHAVSFGPFLQTIEVPLESSPALKLDSSPQFGVTCKLYEHTVHCLLQLIKTWSRTGPKTDPATLSLYWPPGRVWLINNPLWNQPSNHFILFKPSSSSTIPEHNVLTRV